MPACFLEHKTLLGGGFGGLEEKIRMGKNNVIKAAVAVNTTAPRRLPHSSVLRLPLRGTECFESPDSCRITIPFPQYQDELLPKKPSSKPIVVAYRPSLPWEDIPSHLE